MLLDQPEVQSAPLYRSATGGQRFTNFLIDTIMVYIVSGLLGFMIGIVALLVGSDLSFLAEENRLATRLINLIFGSVATILYYTFFEFTAGGKTIGKYVTKTRALTDDDQEMDLRTTAIRSLCRIVPFDTFSFLGDDASGWHDKWSHTKVVDEKKPITP